MAHEIYQHPEPRGKEEHGHDAECEFVNNLGPPCGCSDSHRTSRGLPAPSSYDIHNGMKLAGWKASRRGGESWHREYGPHVIQLSRVNSGWSLRWDKQSGMTFMERGGFGTITDAINYFWGWVANRVDWSSNISWEHSAMTQQLKDAGIEPRSLTKPPQPITAVPGPLKHEVTALMDLEDPEDRGWGRGGA
jgi:hypothetical protein